MRGLIETPKDTKANMLDRDVQLFLWNMRIRYCMSKAKQNIAKEKQIIFKLLLGPLCPNLAMI